MLQSSQKTLFASLHVVLQIHKSPRRSDLVYAQRKGQESESQCLDEPPKRPRHRRLVRAVATEKREQGERDIRHSADHDRGQNDVCQGVVELKQKLDKAGKEEEDRSVEEKGYGIRDGIKPESEYALKKESAYTRPALRR